MKANFRNVIFYVLSLLVLSCALNGEHDDLGSSGKYMRLIGNIDSGNISINILLTSVDSQVLTFDGAMITPGCPYYEESIYIFKSAPKLEELRHSQILIENESHEFKIFSSGILDNGTSVFTNCFETDSIKIELDAHKEKDFIINAMIQMIRINEDDKKVRLHLFYKDDSEKNRGFIASSENWVTLE